MTHDTEIPPHTLCLHLLGGYPPPSIAPPSSFWRGHDPPHIKERFGNTHQFPIRWSFRFQSVSESVVKGNLKLVGGPWTPYRETVDPHYRSMKRSNSTGQHHQRVPCYDRRRRPRGRERPVDPRGGSRGPPRRVSSTTRRIRSVTLRGRARQHVVEFWNISAGVRLG